MREVTDEKFLDLLVDNSRQSGFKDGLFWGILIGGITSAITLTTTLSYLL